jgi:hypothetical protein
MNIQEERPFLNSGASLAGRRLDHHGRNLGHYGGWQNLRRSGLILQMFYSILSYFEGQRLRENERELITA